MHLVCEAIETRSLPDFLQINTNKKPASRTGIFSFV